MISNIHGILIENKCNNEELRLYEKTSTNLEMEWIVLELRDNIGHESFSESRILLSTDEARAIRDYLSMILTTEEDI